MRLLVIVLCLCSTHVFSQNQLGLKLGNYSGINSIALNPALTAFDNNTWDLQLFAAATYSTIDYDLIGEVYSSGSIITDEEKQLNNYYNLLIEKEGFVDIEIQGPAFLYQLDNHRLGFSTQLSGYYDYQIDHNTPVIPDQETYFDQILGAPVQASSRGLVWSEWALHYSYRFAVQEKIKMSVGINPKFLQGYKAGLVDLQSDRIMERIDNDSIHVSIDHATISLGGLDDDYSFGSLIENNGSGYGLDLGWSMLIGNSNSDYMWKLGLSIIDIGKIQFDSKSSVQTFNEENYFYSSDSRESDSDLINVVDIVKQEVDMAFDSTLVADNFNVSLPSSFVAHVEMGKFHPFYIQGIYIKGLSNSSQRIYRSDFIAISPRYEKEHISLQVPISSENFDNLHVGLSARLGPLVLGSEHVISSIISGTSLIEGSYYIGLKFNSGMFGKSKKANK